MTRRPRPLRLFAGAASLAALVSLSGPLRAHVAALGSRVPPGPASVEVLFTRSTESGPVLWSSCDPIAVMVNPGPFGDAATAEIVAAFGEVSALTGLQFQFSTADLVPRSDWALTTGEWSTPPVLVAWVAPDVTDLLGVEAAGATVANPAGRGSSRRIVTGAIALDSTEYASFRAGDGPGRTRRNLLLHEIGHLLGLEHAEGSGLMDPSITESSPDGFHPAESAALRVAYAGRPGC